MGDLKLFSLEKGIVKSLKSESIAIEISLQRLIEKNLEEFLGVHLSISIPNIQLDQCIKVGSIPFRIG